jgi:hypothetical protein
LRFLKRDDEGLLAVGSQGCARDDAFHVYRAPLQGSGTKVRDKYFIFFRNRGLRVVQTPRRAQDRGAEAQTIDARTCPAAVSAGGPYRWAE